MACEHKGCHCDYTVIERQGKRFCSEQCASSELSGRHETMCACGHSDCESSP